MTPLVHVTGYLGSGKTSLRRRLLPLVKQAGPHPHVILNDHANAEVDSATLGALVPGAANQRRHAGVRAIHPAGRRVRVRAGSRAPADAFVFYVTFPVRPGRPGRSECKAGRIPGLMARFTASVSINTPPR